MKAVWHSNASWAPTGYGQQTALVVPRLNKLGHDVAVSVNYGLHGQVMEWDGVKHYPGGADVWGNDILSAHCLDHMGHPADGGVLFTLCDVWVLKAPTLAMWNVASWVPVDHDPLIPGAVEWFGRTGGLPIAMSQWGRGVVEAAGFEARYVPHCVDMQVFTPQPRATSKQRLGLPDDRFVVGMNAANKGQEVVRKAFPQALLAFRELHRRHPDTVMWLHTEQFGVHQGVNLDRMVRDLGLDDVVFFSEQYPYRIGSINQSALSVMYSGFDVLLNPSMGEGFGIPIVEAQACGVPVIANGFSAMPELVDTGWLVDHERTWHESQRSWWTTPLVGSIVDALEEAYEWRGNPAHVRRQMVRYDVDTVMVECWEPLLTELGDWFGPPDLSGVEPLKMGDVLDAPGGYLFRDE